MSELATQISFSYYHLLSVLLFSKSLSDWCLMGVYSVFAGVYWVFTVFVSQCWCWADWYLHRSEHRFREDEIRGCGRPLPNCQITPNSEASHGADRGEKRCRERGLFEVFIYWFWSLLLFSGPVPAVLPIRSGVPGKLWSLCNIIWPRKAPKKSSGTPWILSTQLHPSVMRRRLETALGTGS